MNTPQMKPVKAAIKSLLKDAYEAGRTWQTAEIHEFHGGHENEKPDFEAWFKSIPESYYQEPSSTVMSVEWLTDEEIDQHFNSFPISENRSAAKWAIDVMKERVKFELQIDLRVLRNKVNNAIYNYWKFDDQQQHMSSWHDKQDLMEKVGQIFKEFQKEIEKLEHVPFESLNEKSISLLKKAVTYLQTGSVAPILADEIDDFLCRVPFMNITSKILTGMQAYMLSLRDKGYYYFDIRTNGKNNTFNIYASTGQGGRGNSIDTDFNCDTMEVTINNQYL